MATASAKATLSSLSEAYAFCECLARTHYENFTVGSWLLPRNVRPYLYAIYAFCRHTDDLGDEAHGDRLALLDAWEAEIDAAYTGLPSHPIMIALQDTIARFEIPSDLFRRLIQANRIDQGSGRFSTYNDVLHYCNHSANPVGRMVLYVMGDRSETSHLLSDDTCTALQLANFWQDIRRDYAINRIYIPLEDMAAFQYTEEELAGAVVNDNFRGLMRFEVERAAALFENGKQLIPRLEGRFKLDVALFTKGGMRVLEAIRQQNYDVLTRRPTVTKSRKFWLFGATWLSLRLGRTL